VIPPARRALVAFGVFALALADDSATSDPVVTDTIPPAPADASTDSAHAAPAAATAPPDRPIEGPDRERWFFSDWHGRNYGAVLPEDVYRRMRAEVDAVPPEPDLDVVGWTLAGPRGMTTENAQLYSGRVLDIDWDLSGPYLQVWIATASGGLWRYDDTPPNASVPLTDALPTLAVGTVSVDPVNPQNIVIGTGEYGVRGGLGIYRTTDGGSTWAPAAYDPGAGIPHRIRHVNSSLLLGTASEWTIRSTDGGASWTKIVDGGPYFDLALNPAAPDTAFATYSDGTTAHVVRTTDGGLSWHLVGPAVANALRGAVAISWSNPSVLYAAFAGNQAANFAFRGAYKSTDGGVTWTSVLAAAGNNYMNSQGWYDNVVSVFPYDENIVWLAGVGIKHSTDGGATWDDADVSDVVGLHPDFHAAEWVAFFFPRDGGPRSFGGRTVPRGVFAPAFLGHDGGWSWSDDFGNTWQTDLNTLPITQYMHVHAAQGNLQILGGGSQDNGISVTTDGGTTWVHRQGGDGSSLSIDATDHDRMWSVVGTYSGALTFRRHRSTDAGVTWTDRNVGIAPDDTWFPELDNDQVAPVRLYTSAGTQVYQSTDYADNWTPVGNFSQVIRSLRVGRFSVPSAAVWAVLDDSTSGDRIHVYDGANWTPCDAGLPTGAVIRSVIPHPVEPNTALALINGIGTPGQKIFRTTDRGATWANVTGDLPDVPLGGIVAHPLDPNVLYLGTEMGCFRGVFAGSWFWRTWNTGMPSAPIVSDLSWVDLLDSTGEFWIVAGTYGRSIYRREALDLEEGTAAPVVASAPGMSLAPSAPNPVAATGVTRLSFSLPKAGTVKLQIFDVTGREVATLVDGMVPQGRHEVSFRPNGIAPGVYFCRLRAGSHVLSRKLTILR
jgi:photosystem II stability/assembly factor-like uncharacterized protein